MKFKYLKVLSPSLEAPETQLTVRQEMSEKTLHRLCCSFAQSKPLLALGSKADLSLWCSLRLHKPDLLSIKMLNCSSDAIEDKI